MLEQDIWCHQEKAAGSHDWGVNDHNISILQTNIFCPSSRRKQQDTMAGLSLFITLIFSRQISFPGEGSRILWLGWGWSQLNSFGLLFNKLSKRWNQINVSRRKQQDPMAGLSLFVTSVFLRQIFFPGEGTGILWLGWGWSRDARLSSGLATHLSCCRLRPGGEWQRQRQSKIQRQRQQ